MSTIRQTLDGTLLQVNSDFWDLNPLDSKNPVQDMGRRTQIAMQVYLRLWLLVASRGKSVTHMH